MARDPVSRLASILAALVFVAMAGSEATHFVRWNPWPGYATAANWLFVTLVPLWLAAAVSLVSRTDGDRLALVEIAGILAAVIHFTVIKLGQGGWAYLYLSGAVLATLLVGLRAHRARREREQRPSRPPPMIQDGVPVVRSTVPQKKRAS